MSRRNVPRAFVSSTFLDLREIRKLVGDQLVGLDILPVGMEIFPSAGAGPWEIIKSAIDDCDLYVLLVAGRYGSLCPGSLAGRSGLSWTEKEYEYARSKGKYIIAMLHNSPNTLARDLVDESSSQVWGFRKRLEDEVLVRRYATEAELITGLHHSVNHYFRSSEDGESSAGRPSKSPDLQDFLERAFDRYYKLFMASWSLAPDDTGKAWDANYRGRRMVRAQWAEGLNEITIDHNRASDRHKAFNYDNPPVVRLVGYERTESGAAELAPPRIITSSKFLQDVAFRPALRRGETCTIDLEAKFPSAKFAYRDELLAATAADPSGKRSFDRVSFKVGYPTDRLVLSCFLPDLLLAEPVGFSVCKGRSNPDLDEIGRIEREGFFKTAPSQSPAGDPGLLLTLDVSEPAHGRSYELRWRPPCRK